MISEIYKKSQINSQIFIHPSSTPLHSVQGGGVLEPIPSCYGGRQITPWTGQDSSPSQETTHHTFTLIFTPKGNLGSPVSLTCMILNCGRKRGRNPGTQRENMQTPHRKTAAGILTWPECLLSDYFPLKSTGFVFWLQIFFESICKTVNMSSTFFLICAFFLLVFFFIIVISMTAIGDFLK